MAKLKRGDLRYIAKLTQKTSKSVERRENLVSEISPVHTLETLYRERFSKPEVYRPLREYNQKNEDTPLPDSNLQTMWRDLSIRAAQAWDEWVKTLELPMEQLLLDEEELISYIRYKRMALVEEARQLQQEARDFGFARVEIPGFSNSSLGLVKRDKYTRTFSDYLEDINRTDYETNIWRKSFNHEKDSHLLPNCTIWDDPDYINPSSLNRSFSIIKPASRPYNCIFRVYFDTNRYKVVNPSCDKDYTDINDIKYLYSQKGIHVEKVTIEYCRFEYDLRVTYSNVPDPKNYKKIDPLSPAGIKIMNLLNEQPNLFKEFSWIYETENEIEKKVAYGLVTRGKESEVIYWVYLDNSMVKKGASFFQNRKVKPQLHYKEFRDSRGIYHKLMAEIRYHKSTEYRYQKIGNKIERVNICDMIRNKLKENYTFTKSEEDIFGVISEYYIRNDAKTRKDQRKILK